MDAEWNAFLVYLLPWITIGLLFTLFVCYRLEKSHHAFLAGLLFCFQLPFWILWPILWLVYIMQDSEKIVLTGRELRRRNLEGMKLKQVRIDVPCPRRVCKAYALISDGKEPGEIVLVRVNRTTASVEKLAGQFYEDEFGNRYSIGSGGSVRMVHMTTKEGYFAGAPLSFRF